jgi:hypothetical protein
MMLVHDHLNMQCRQFLLNLRQVKHPSHKVTGRPPGPRPKRNPTLQYQYGSDIEKYLTPDGTISEFDYKEAVKAINMEAGTTAFTNREAICIFGVLAPVVNPEEDAFPRVTRMTMRQLRSGHCKELQSYKHKLNSAISENCPDCRLSPHIVPHLFTCPANSIQLTLINL